ncbi:hypothetical protein EDB19DRAFT_1914867 [Suillus lakei]|nr:hypothetical protein EDB19DRAFT_1914867 [Suillus lakei]
MREWSFVPGKGWWPDFFKSIDLGELIDDGHWKQMGTAKGQVQAAGSPIGQGLSRQAAEEPRLVEGMFWGRLAAVAGTSTCHLVQHDIALPFLRNVYARLFALLGGPDRKAVTSPLFLYPKVAGPGSPAFPPATKNITTSRHCCSHLSQCVSNVRNHFLTHLAISSSPSTTLSSFSSSLLESG